MVTTPRQQQANDAAFMTGVRWPARGLGSFIVETHPGLKEAICKSFASNRSVRTVWDIPKLSPYRLTVRIEVDDRIIYQHGSRTRFYKAMTLYVTLNNQDGTVAFSEQWSTDKCVAPSWISPGMEKWIYSWTEEYYTVPDERGQPTTYACTVGQDKTVSRQALLRFFKACLDEFLHAHNINMTNGLPCLREQDIT